MDYTEEHPSKSFFTYHMEFTNEFVWAWPWETSHLCFHPLAVICLFKLFVSSRFNFCKCVHIEIYLFCILIFLIHTGRETERDGVREVGGQTACGSWFSLSIRWVPNIEFRLLGLLTSTLTTSLSHKLKYKFPKYALMIFWISLISVVIDKYFENPWVFVGFSAKAISQIQLN